MQTIGLIGGMSWESTAVYYRMLNEQVRGRLGGFHSAEILMRSVDFDDIVNLQKQGRWDEACEVLANIARALQDGGAGCLLICTNTMHKLADDVQRAVSIRLLHIADVTANAIKTSGCKGPLLLATRYTMEQDFYVQRLRESRSHRARQVARRRQRDPRLYRNLPSGRPAAHRSSGVRFDAVAR
jgi:aspartate racemase